MVVERMAAWLKDAAPRLQGLLQRVLPPLLAHPQPAVRAALAAGQPAHNKSMSGTTIFTTRFPCCTDVTQTYAWLTLHV